MTSGDSVGGSGSGSKKGGAKGSGGGGKNSAAGQGSAGIQSQQHGPSAGERRKLEIAKIVAPTVVGGVVFLCLLWFVARGCSRKLATEAVAHQRVRAWVLVCMQRQQPAAVPRDSCYCILLDQEVLRVTLCRLLDVPSSVA